MSERKYRVEKINYEVLTPFGPSVMTGTIPKNIYVQFKDMVEGIVKEKKLYSNFFKFKGLIAFGNFKFKFFINLLI